MENEHEHVKEVLFDLIGKNDILDQQCSWLEKRNQILLAYTKVETFKLLDGSRLKILMRYIYNNRDKPFNHR